MKGGSINKSSCRVVGRGILGRICVVLVVLASACVGLHAQDRETGKSKLPPPDFADVAYGTHERQVMDVWLAPTKEPAPLLIYFHGGGFITGRKENLPRSVLLACLKAGISVASANYRFSPEVKFPAHYLDGARALQFARSQAAAWKIDPTRVALGGSSAGAATVLWIAFHDDMADPQSSDPVARQSTRVSCVVVAGAQPTYDRRVIRELAGEAAARHAVFANLHGLSADELDTPKAYELYTASAPLTHLTADDPPVFAYYSEPRGKVEPTARDGTGIHHPNLGLLLQQRMQALGIECVFRHKDEGADVNAERIEFLRRHLGLAKGKGR